MKPVVVFRGIEAYQPGTIVTLLVKSYRDLLQTDPACYRSEMPKWQGFDREVIESPNRFSHCVFFSWHGDICIGFGSFDPRGKPTFGVIGHHCILPEFRRRGFGRQQLQEILRRLKNQGIKQVRVTTGDHPFFIPAQRLYLACGFKEVRREGPHNTGWSLIHYEREIEYIPNLKEN